MQSKMNDFAYATKSRSRGALVVARLFIPFLSITKKLIMNDSYVFNIREANTGANARWIITIIVKRSIEASDWLSHIKDS